MSEEFNRLLKKEKSKFENSTSAESRQFKIQNSKFNIAPSARGWGFKLNIQNCAFGAWGFIMKKYNKPMIAVRYVDIQGICAGSVIHLDPSNNAYEDACSKGNTTQLSIRDVWED